MKFRRKAQGEPVDDELVDDLDELDDDDDEEGEDADLLADGPFDSEDLPADDVERVDLGSLLIAPEPDRELRLQVDEASGAVQSVQLVGPDGAVELRAFAAPRNGDLWTEVRPQIAAEVAQGGGTATEHAGPWGTELILRTGQRGGQQQVVRMIGVNGPRWMLRCHAGRRSRPEARRVDRLGGHDPPGGGPSGRARHAGGRGPRGHHAAAGAAGRPAGVGP